MAARSAVLRAAVAVTSTSGAPEIDESMRRVGPDEVFEALRPALEQVLAR